MEASIETEKVRPAGERTRRTHITWDEETIAEHDKERGTRMKIDEPPTPYHVHYEPDSDCESASSFRDNSFSGPGTPSKAAGQPGYLAEHWDTLTSKLEAAATRPPSLSASFTRSISDDSATSAASGGESEGGRRGVQMSGSVQDYRRGSADPEAAQHFAEKRQQHYDEFARLQKWRRKLAAGEISDDEDDNDEENMK